MRVELVSIGTELLLGHVINTNAQWLARECSHLGLNLYHQQVVGDNFERLVDVITTALARADLVICTGGLGPTQDDITRDAAAAATGRSLIEDQQARSWLEERMGRFDRKLSKSNLKQALIPEGAIPLRNEMGTAPGVWLEASGKHLILLPGPPREMQWVFSQEAMPRLRRIIGSHQIISRRIRCVGIGESSCADLLDDLISTQTSPSIALYADIGEVEVKLTARAESREQALKVIKPVEDEIKRRLGQHVYGFDDDSLPAVAARLLVAHEKRIAVAESCTGGLLGHNLVSIPGASRYFDCGVICYSNAAKRELCGVDGHIIDSHGAVSAECAKSMAEGLRRRVGVDLTVSITGIAGPSGGTELKPVGTVFVAVAGEKGTCVQRFLFSGDRQGIQVRSVKAALNMVRLYLQGVGING